MGSIICNAAAIGAFNQDLPHTVYQPEGVTHRPVEGARICVNCGLCCTSKCIYCCVFQRRLLMAVGNGALGWGK
jgi:hypothetical protein